MCHLLTLHCLRLQFDEIDWLVRLSLLAKFLCVEGWACPPTSVQKGDDTLAGGAEQQGREAR